MTPQERRRFDRLVDEVIRDLPEEVLEKIEEVPVVVEDRPSEEVMREQGLEAPDELCGLYSGTPLIDRGTSDVGPLPDRITLYREAIIEEARDDDGRVHAREIERQIRLTILHEMGHHFGLGEEELGELGYE